MHKWTIALLLLLILTACGPAAAPTPEPDEAVRPTPTSDPALLNNNASSSGQNNQVGYPPPPPTATPYPDNYPAPAAAPTAVNPYPALDDSSASPVWILHPLGQQCADTSTYQYPNQQDARADLTAVGITVYQMETTELTVCEACNCPTSTHYRAQISSADLQKAVSLGWQEE